MHNPHDPRVLPMRDGVNPSCVVLPSQGQGSLLDFLCQRLPAVARDLVDDRFVKKSIAALGGMTAFGLPENFTRSETIVA